MTTSEKRPITADDLYQLNTVFDPQISPDGRHVIFCVRWVDRVTEKKYTNLWLVPTDGRFPARQFTTGQQADTHPRWSPDGRSIAFLSNRDDEKQPQLYRIPFDGGEAKRLTDLRGSFSGFEWSPDGRRLLCQFRKKDQEAIDREADEQTKKLGIVSRRITQLDYRFNGAGYLPQEKWHIWIIDADTGEATQLTDGDRDHVQPTWFPDGRRILFIVNRAEQPDLERDETELFTIPADGGEMEMVPAHDGRKHVAAVSPDGQWIAYLGREKRGHWYQNDALYLAPAAAAADNDPVNLSAAYDIYLATMTSTDSGSGSPQTPPTWASDNAHIYNQATYQGDQPLLLFSTDRDMTAVIDEPGLVGAFTLDAEQNKMAYLWGTLDRPGQIWLRDMASGETRQLTQLNEDLFAEIDLGHTEEVWFPGPDGRRLHGWITFPPDFDPEKQYPSILEIHGGPMTQYGRGFMHEFRYLAAHGYIVYWSNPRGSAGYGEEHTGAIFNQWGTVDYEDVMAWADYVADQPYIDTERMGVTGGSYGGYMTILIIGKTDRFRAAVAQRVVSNFISFYGSSDLHVHTEALTGLEGPPWDNLDSYWDQSPMKYIGGATTPTMIMHSEQDLRCNLEQGTQVFTALRRLGVETELILFPEETHDLSRSGRTDRRIARLEHMRRWFDAYLS